ncbi:pullulanase-type alpha-1,6-glucosidase [Sphingomicrobium arenosum]|uniref:pullulanase-type alpha-1,6-glucosidase n=1 Tax=Sphingomicrobium arenosum TaxID=2233861 RepID=UPI002240F7CB|nr:pullulanase-type alpha-1,6-glucosidase [Sphingomicrobium arenosum]
MRGRYLAGALVAALVASSGCAPVTVESAATDWVRPGDARAHWLAPDLIAYDGVIAPTLLAGTMRHSLAPAGKVDGALAAAHPHLEGLALWRLDAARDDVRQMLKGPVALDRTGLQIGPVLDALYADAAKSARLGARFADDGSLAIALWAPTARSVKLHLFDTPTGPARAVRPMTEDPASGVWSVTGEPDWKGAYYLYEVEVHAPTTGRIETNMVTDPYALGLAANAGRTLIVDMDDPATKPEGWDAFARDLDGAAENRSIYELHVRDFSIGDTGIPVEKRGRYAAFADPATAGVKHLSRLANAGLSDVHLLPTNDCASIEERADHRVEPVGLDDYGPASEVQQQILDAADETDGFNWCYDPLHYLAPEGSYASDPDGTARIREFRAMVMGLDAIGLGTVLDVVFNHTPGHGQSDRAVLDRIVPGYYQRLMEDGSVANSTCCSNTATERVMMEKLMRDGLMVWARDYKVSGFRFDLMAHHAKDHILAEKADLAQLTLAKDGVDGADLLIYGEGWDYGEVGGDARFVQADQANMGAGSGIGTFNDRFRDALRGGRYNSRGDEAITTQGFASGLFTAPNAMTSADAAARARLLTLTDHVRAGLAGSLADYRFISADGTLKAARELDYDGHPVGYVSDPQESVNYAAAHDNPTLFDNNAWRLPRDISREERVRWQNMATSLIVLAQGMPFIHAGQELLRTKSLDHNSYNSGDWFNAVDFSGQRHHWGRGLPPKQDNEVDWPHARALLADPRLEMTSSDIARATAHLEELFALRMASPLFRMKSAEEVQAKLRFLNTGPDQIPGLIVMMLGEGDPGDLMVVFNATRETQALDADPAAYALHPVQAASDDAVLRAARPDAVPSLTTAVFVVKD